MRKPRKIVVLGATGSIGTQTLTCIDAANRAEPGTFQVTGLSAFTSMETLLHLSPLYPEAALAISGLVVAPENEINASGHKVPIFAGPQAIDQLLDSVPADLVVNGVAGAAGFRASISALTRGCNLALANKESVVMGFSQIKAMAERKGLSIIPVDSEHAGLFQLVSRIGSASITELCITGSGGPFRTLSLSELRNLEPDDAAQHPVWKMGRKISIDSATLANKGLELIEAVRLFGLPEEDVRILIHPESIIHALVRTKDSALYAYMSEPDMKLPINIALHWPDEVPSLFGRLDLAGKTLHFEDPDLERFPMLRLARESVRIGEAATNAYNAANEIAVAAFERRAILFTQIPEVVERTLSHDWHFPVPDVDSIFEVDTLARKLAHSAVLEISC
ncbi:MAG: 1-deoxy-D-xylulose-5-phosphate reductoisomerase [Spirochaetaceae bacterium]|nr:1-deoxy-D-xylulose-5-phosphate reductoisomerase [Spirochaetaceae bacterium]